MTTDPEILITGGNGKLGQAIDRRIRCLALPKQELDVTNFIQVTDYLKNHQNISCIIHAAAMTSVTKCEQERKEAYRINVNGTRNIIRAIKENNIHPSGTKREIKLIYISTPCIFDGKSGNYDEDSIPQPVNYYGLTKLISEELIKLSGLQWLILRTNFVAEEEWPHPKAFTDRFGTYLFASDVADSLIYHMKHTEGVIHVVGDKKMSMFELAKLTSKKVRQMTLKEYYKQFGNKVHLTEDMTMVSKRWPAKRINTRLP